ncbi:hypothetical protein U1Q18_024614 [Sarracenia purpurea var. burkii]
MPFSLLRLFLLSIAAKQYHVMGRLRPSGGPRTVLKASHVARSSPAPTVRWRTVEDGHRNRTQGLSSPFSLYETAFPL